jgi:NTP pyrophosphatase (non-canonical NTP hydrolase)
MSEFVDLVKKDLIYGKPIEEEKVVAVLDFPEQPLHKEKALDSTHMEFLHHAMGANTEGGEVLKAVLAAIFDGKPLDKTNIREEIGDVLWYLAGLCRLCDTTLEAEMERNIAKLAKRYPGKYTDEAALNRNLDAEREVLEKTEHHSV